MKKGAVRFASPPFSLRRNIVTSICLFAGLLPSIAGQPVAEWWNGKYAAGNWLGLRDALEDRGVIFTGSWKGTFYGIVDGGVRRSGAFDEELHFHLKLDFERMLGLTGLSAYGSVRWRDGENPIFYTGTSAAFNPSNTQVGKQWRLMPLYLTWESRDLLPVKDMITLSGGWTNPYFAFIQQPESRLFVNNAIHQTKGLVNSGFPWSGAYNTWGGHIKVKPVEWYYGPGRPLYGDSRGAKHREPRTILRGRQPCG